MFIVLCYFADPLMKPFLEYLHTFLSISGPHLGYMYSSNTLFNSGLWLLKKLKASPCMHQLTFTDETNIQDCFLFKLSEEKSFEYFQNVVLLSSPQVRRIWFCFMQNFNCSCYMLSWTQLPVYTVNLPKS